MIKVPVSVFRIELSIMVLCHFRPIELALCTRTQLNEAKYIESHFEKESFSILFHLIPVRPVFSNKTPYDDAIDAIDSIPPSLNLFLLVHSVSPLQRCPRGCCSYVAGHKEVHVQLWNSIYIDAVPVAAKHVYYILRIAF